MRVTTFAATAVLATAALGVTAGTASGQTPDATQVAGSDHGVHYSASWTPDGSSVSTTVVGGTFRTAADGAEVVVTAADGKRVGDIPLVYGAAGHQVRIQPQIDATGTTLTLQRPAAAAAHRPDTHELKNIGFYVSNATIVDVAVGCVIGALIGAIFGILPGIPGCLIGGVIGYFYAGNRI